MSIVGVIADVRDHALDEPPARRAYAPYKPIDTIQTNPEALRFAIRVDGDPRRIIDQVRRTVAAVDPMLPIDGIDPLSTLMRQSIREQRLVATLATWFGVLALVLAGIGLYGVVTYATVRRTGEMGLRMALGAQRQAILRLVVAEALRLVAIGMMVGVPLVVASTRLLRAQLHGVPTLDPVSIALALAVLGVSAGAAALLPALRAMRVSPLLALQAE